MATRAKKEKIVSKLLKLDRSDQYQQPMLAYRWIVVHCRTK
jgi:hypothetical protein